MNGIFSVFDTRSLNQDEVENAENYQTVFLTPDSNAWDPYDDSYKENEDSNLDSRGRMVMPTTPTHHDLVRDTDISAAMVIDRNDVAMSATDSINHHNVSWKEDMLEKRKKRKIRDKIHRIKASATFELSVAEAQLADLDSGEAACDAPPTGDWSTSKYLPDYSQPEEWAPLPNLPLPIGWSQASPIDSVLQLPVVVAAMDSVIETSVAAVDAHDCRTSQELEDECELFKMDPVCAEVAAISCTYDPVLFCDLLDDHIALSKFSTAVGSTTARIQDPDSVMDFWDSDSDYASVTDDLKDAFAGASHAEKPKGVDSKLLQKIWRIDSDTAKRTIKTTTQLNRQDVNSKLSRNFGTNDRMLRYRRIKSFFFTDTFFVTKKAASSRGFTCMQIFVSDMGFVYVSAMKSPAEFPKALKMFAREVGVPEAIIADSHKCHKSKEVRLFCHKIGTTLRVLEGSTQWANRAELYVGLFKEAVRKDMLEENSPLIFWDFCTERRALITNMTAKDLFQLQGQTPHFATFGEEGDISNICQFGWYEWVYARETEGKFPYPSHTLGRCLGPAKNEGNEMSQWVLKQSGEIVPRRTMRKLTPDELVRPSEVKKSSDFDAAIKARYGDSFTLPTKRGDTIDDDGTFDLPFDEVAPQIPEADITDADGNSLTELSAADILINAEVLLPQGEEMRLAKVIKRSLNPDGKVTGNYNDIPVLNTMLYDVQFPDGSIKPYSANLIAENILSQVDQDGYHNQMLEGILDHAKDGRAVDQKNQWVVSKRGRRSMRKTTVGWKFKVKWKDGTVTWSSLKDLRQSNPVDVAVYVTSRDIQNEPAFSWWVPWTLRKRDTIIASVNSRMRKATHKYGIEIPTSVKHAEEIDKKNGNTLWQDAIRLEMSNIGVAFDILERGENPPPGYSKSSGHMIYDVKMDFTRKGRWVKDGHRTPDPESSSYAGVVSRESIRILLTHAALHGVPVMAADVRNAYLQAPTSEKHYIICGPEFGIEHVGKKAVITQALYGGKCAGRDFWHHLRSCMKFLGFESSRADPDVWMRESVREDGFTKYYEYVLLYTDDCLVISDRGESVLRNEIGKYFSMKESSIGAPSKYLGGKLRMVELENGQKCWAFGSGQYVKEAVQNVLTHLKKRGDVLAAKAPTPMTCGYRPEVDTTPELGLEDAAYYHSLIGVLRWIVELGRIDINVEVSMLSSHLALPREGHMQELFHVFAYLKKHLNSEMVFDPSEPDIDMNAFQRQDWSYSIYSSPGDEPREAIPPNMPKPLGKGFKIRCFVDADHAGETLTRRSRTGFIVMLNNAPIYWFSKKNASVETSTFGSEFMAMKQATEYLRGLRYKLRMFGIPVDEPAFVYGDNQSVLVNSSMPASTLKKKSQAIAFHFVREGCAADEWRTTYINTNLNVADLMTKPLSGEKRWRFVRMLLHYL